MVKYTHTHTHIYLVGSEYGWNGKYDENDGFSTPHIETKQERTLYSSPLGYSDSRKISSLISLTDLADSQLIVLHPRSSQFARFGASSASFDLSKTTLPRMTYLTFRRFTSRKQPPEHSYRPIAAYFYLIQTNYIL